MNFTGNHSHTVGINEFSDETEEESFVSCVIEEDEDELKLFSMKEDCHIACS